MASAHVVQFYASDAFMLDEVAAFLQEGLRATEPALVVATPAHCVAIEQRLSAAGIDCAGARASGHYRSLDAAETLARFLRDGQPDEARFRDVIGGAIGRLNAERRPRSFGEMVALLVADGQPAAALQLEEMWNELQKELSFSLLCAYPLDDLRDAAGAELVPSIGAAHGHVIPAESYSAAATPDDRALAIVGLQQQAARLEGEIEAHSAAKEQLAERARLASLSATISRALTDSESLRDGLHRCAAALVTALDAGLVRIWTLDESSRTLVLEASAGSNRAIDGSQGRIAIGESVIGAIALQRRPRLASHADGDGWDADLDAKANATFAAFAGYPLTFEERVVGVLAVYARHLSGAALEALSSVSSGIALGIERRRAAEVAKVGEERWRGVFASSALGVAVLTPDARFLDVNAAFCAITGYSADELRALDCGAITHPDDVASMVARLDALLAGAIGTFVIEKRYRRKDGRISWVRNTVSATYDRDGRAERLIAVCEDITARKEAEAVLAGQTRVFELIAAGAPLAEALSAIVQLIEAHADGLRASILVRDPAGDRFCLCIAPSLPEGYVAALNAAPILPPYLGPCAEATHRGIALGCSDIAADRRWSEEWRHLAASYGLHGGYSAPIVSAGGDGIGAFCLYTLEPRDQWPPDEKHFRLATHLAGIAIERWRVEAERERLLAAEKAALAEAEAAIRTRDEFLGSVTHDLRTPLTTMRGQSQLLQRQLARLDHPRATRLREQAQVVEHANTQMAHMVDELLDVTQLEGGRELQLQRQSVDLLTLVERAVTEQQRRAAEHRIRLHNDVPALPGVWDNDRLERVVANLLSNAVKYSPDGGTIAVRLRSSLDGEGKHWAELTVEDDGIGIPAADLPHVFERFHRASNVKGRIKGTGIGLAGAKQIIEQHGGTITVVSEEGAGTRVTVRLPSLPPDSAGA